MIFQRTEWKIFVNGLGDLVGRLDIQRDFGDDAECTEAYDGAGENVGILFAGECHDVAGCVDKFERGDSAGKVAVVYAGAVRAGGDSTGNRNMRKRSEIVQGEVLCF